MTDPLFSDNGNNNTSTTIEDKDYAAELIGDGKKYKDLSSAARALVEKDMFIERLKAEAAEARAALQGEKKMDEFFEKLKGIQSNTGTASTQVTSTGEHATTQNSQPNNNNPKALTAEEVQELLEKRDREKQEAANLQLAVQKVKEAYGANYTAVMRQKAEELGMSPEYLTGLAKSQPKAFLKLVEADSVQNQKTFTPTSSVNTAAMGGKKTGERNNEYYKTLRKQIGDAEFFKPKVQNQLHSDMLRLREAFFQ